jgi:hypothetical protein
MLMMEQLKLPNQVEEMMRFFYQIYIESER